MEYPARKVYQEKDIVRKYDARRFTGFKGRLIDKLEKALIIKALKYAGLTPPSAILDLPCGTGRISLYLSKMGFQIRSVDISKEMVLLTKENASRFNLSNRIAAEVGDAEVLPYPDNSFEACVSLRLLGHTPPENRIKILTGLRRVVKQYLIIAYYHRNCLRNILRAGERRQLKWYPVTYKEIEEELKTVKLKRIKYFPLLRGISETIIVLAKK